MSWNTSFDKILFIRGVFHPQWIKQFEPQNQAKIDQWKSWYKDNRHIGFPPGIITEDGTMIDGNHRLQAARDEKLGLWCNLVEYDNGWKYIAGMVYVT